MSLIFKALQRFDSPEATRDKDRPEVPPKRNTFSLRKLLLSPSITLGAAAAIFLMGLAASQVIRFFPHKMKDLTPTVQAAMPEQTVRPDPTARETFEVGADSEPGISPHTLAEDAHRRVSFQVHPPEDATPSAANGPAASDGIRFHVVDSDVEKKEGGDSPAGRSSSPMHRAALGSNEEKAAFFPATGTQKEDISDSEGVSPPKVLGLVRPDAVSPPIVSETEPDGATPSSSTFPNPRKRSGENPQYQRQAEQATKHLQVSQLAQRIYGAIQADDALLTSRLLAELTRMKGADHSFVIKLKAFSLIRQNRLEEARTLLSKVLANSADDLDAGLNMAVIDMKSGRLDSARLRLVRLHEMFPENANITMYLSKLQH